MAELNAIDLSFWKGRRVLITGHTGFKGSWLALWLADLGAEVHGLSLDPETEPNHFALAGLTNTLTSDHRVDIRDETATRRAIDSVSPEIVFHMAAQALVRRAHGAPLETFAANVMGTAHVLDALRHVDNLSACVAITTDKVYRNLERTAPYVEQDNLGGHEPYGTSKAAAEMVIEAWRHSWFLPAGKGLIAVRAGNVVGGGDWSADRLVPDFVRAASRKEDLVLRNPDGVRPWQHVLEPLLGYIFAAQMLAQDPHSLPGALNFGPDANDFRSVRDVSDHAVAAWDGSAAWRHEPDGSIPESTLLTLDNALARKVLGWRPRWGFETCIRRTIRWYRAALEPGADVAAISRAEIRDFMEQEMTG